MGSLTEEETKGAPYLWTELQMIHTTAAVVKIQGKLLHRYKHEGTESQGPHLNAFGQIFCLRQIFCLNPSHRSLL